MKRSRFVVILVLTLVFGSLAAQPKYTAPRLSNPQSWSLILVPDPQTYVKFERNQPILDLMTTWIKEVRDSLNVQMVLCTGDLVEQNEMINPDFVKANQPSKRQWEAVARSFGKLDGVVPYITAAGNHDYGYRSAENRKTNFNHYFPVDKNPLTQRLVREVGLNGEGVPTLENAAFEFTSPQGRKFLFLSLEFAPRDTALAWARSVVGQEKYRAHTVVVLTHSYLDAKNQHIEKEGYPLTDVNYGAAMWRKLVQPSRNIQMVFSGHIAAPNNVKAHLGFRTDVNAGGRKVHQMMFNAQALGGGWHGNGGDGWLRILEFLPDGRTVKVRTFSPLFAISPTTQPFAWRTEPYDEFSFQLDEPAF